MLGYKVNYVYQIITVIFYFIETNFINAIATLNDDNNSCSGCKDFHNLVASRTAKRGEMPYQVSIQRVGFNDTNNIMIGKHICSGVIFNEDTIITAANCVECRDLNAGESYRVAYGNQNLRNAHVNYSKILNVFPHPANEGVPYNDIAVLKITPKIQFNEINRPVTLSEVRPKNAFCTLSGWSRCNKPPSKTRRLKILNVRITENNCKDLPNYMDGYVLCAERITHENDCVGDIGSPLICGQTLVGIVSSLADCHKGYPDIYMDISYYRNWILKSENDIFLTGGSNAQHFFSVLSFIITFLLYLLKA